ncbi:MAG: hypothetical protein HQL23_06675 [Candidatus Omnitrophica bacterium]|nr:hypothetical protein [Candidatus Omnitrophota bacterium]
MPDVSVIELIRQLVALQNIDADYYVLKEQLDEKPARLAQITQEFDKKKVNLHAQEEKLKTALLTRKQVELDLKAKEDALAKSNAQLSLLKTNKEYTAKIGEIEGLKADQSQLEEKVLVSFEEIDKVTAEVNKEKTALVDDEKQYLDAKAQIEKDIEEIKGKMAAIEGQRKQLLPGIDAKHLRRYERILENKGGLAIAPVRNMACGGCFMNITAQTLDKLRMATELIECGICSRILYLEDSL